MTAQDALLDLKEKISVKISKEIKGTESVQFAKIDTNFRNEYQKIFKKKDLLLAKYNLEEYKDSLDLLIYRFITSDIVNGVCPFYAGHEIDLDLVEKACIKLQLRYQKFGKFSGLPVHFEQKGLKFTALFFKSGKINCVGLQKDTKQYLDLVASILGKFGKEINASDIEKNSTKVVANRVYSITIPTDIELDRLDLYNQSSFWKNIKYNNQSFPGVIQKMDQTKAKILFFKTGSMITTGVTSFEVKVKVLKEFLSALVEYLEIRKRAFNDTDTSS